MDKEKLIDKLHRKMIKELFRIFDRISIIKGSRVDEDDKKRFDLLKRNEDELYEEAVQYSKDFINNELK